ncbi:MAG: dTDP-4-dehydrorhamnose reductase [Gemmatimonadaceae bacterium]
MKVLVTGGGGQLARGVRQTWTGHDLVVPDESVLDLGNAASIHAVMEAARPDVVLNLGAFTEVDRCETEPDLAFQVNAKAVGWLAEACGEQGAMLVQISTDYVFDGKSTRPYREDDATNPISTYGHTKLEGERFASQCPRHLIARTSWLYDSAGKNFLVTMLAAAAQGRKLRVVDDQRGAPTSCRALARQLRVAVEQDWQGLVHATCKGETTWFEFAKTIFEYYGVTVDIQPCATADYPTPARRPAYSVLDCTHRCSLGLDLMPDWRDALREVVEHPVSHQV